MAITIIIIITNQNHKHQSNTITPITCGKPQSRQRSEEAIPRLGNPWVNLFAPNTNINNLELQNTNTWDGSPCSRAPGTWPHTWPPHKHSRAPLQAAPPPPPRFILWLKQAKKENSITTLLFHWLTVLSSQTVKVSRLSSMAHLCLRIVWNQDSRVRKVWMKNREGGRDKDKNQGKWGEWKVCMMMIKLTHPQQQSPWSEHSQNLPVVRSTKPGNHCCLWFHLLVMEVLLLVGMVVYGGKQLCGLSWWLLLHFVN